MTDDILISGESLVIGYAKPLYQDLNFTLKQGEFVCLLGCNGAGKSTLLRTISGIQSKLGGNLRIKGDDIFKLSSEERSRQIGVVLTDRIQTGGLTVMELVTLGRYPYTGYFGRLSAHDYAVSKQMLALVGMSGREDDRISSLSDGERQKIMIAKALAQECPLLLLDEPTAFLDISSRIELMNLLRLLARQERKTILLSTHDMEMALRTADKLWLLSQTEGLSMGAPEDLVTNGQFARYFVSGQVTFNDENGVFRMGKRSQKRVYITTEHLKYWARNVVERCGLQVIEEPTSDYVLQIDAAHKIYLSLDGKLEYFSSFEDLAKRLITLA